MIFNDENFPPLPASWTTVRVDEACTLVTIREKIKTKNYLNRGSLAVVDQGSALVGGYSNDASKVVETTLPVVVFGDHTRALKFVDFPFAAGADGIKVLRPSASLHPRLVFRFLEAIKLPDRGYGRHFQHFRGSRIPVPPLDEQGRIADKLDAVLVRVDACRDRLDCLPGILKRFRQSVLAAATSGDLTVEWRANAASGSWSSRRLGELAIEVKNGLSPKPAEQPPGTPILRINAVRPFFLRQDDLRFLQDSGNTSAYELRVDDLLFTRYSGSLEFVGICARVRAINNPRLVYPDKLIRVRIDVDKALSSWIEIAVNAPAIREIIERTARTSAGQTGISGKDLKELKVPIPSLREQAEIVRRVESLFAWADRLEARLATARARVERLTPSLLAKAFRGELVPQDPADEPASELLKRLTQQPSANPNAPVKRQGSKPHHAKASQAASNVREESSS